MTTSKVDKVASALLETLTSDDVCSSSFNHANVVDVINHLAIATSQIANAITPATAAACKDPYGGVITSLTESAIGITHGLADIASAIRTLAEAIESSK